ncbi:PA14 domain-containing protein, partial [Aquimarina pacifica]|uniref:PA14 domain-containing protein n=1 Tax=Aquimarina pacifica TaxID=1296415 RepID=UPI0013764C2B
MKNKFCLLKKRKTNFSIFLLLFITVFSSYGQTIISSVTELAEAVSKSNQNIVMQAGVYDIGDYLTPANIDSKTPADAYNRKAMLRFSGSNNTFDFTGVTINIPTSLLSYIGRGIEFHLTGSNINLKGLTVTNTGNSLPANPGIALMTVTGDYITLENVTLNVAGSSPYGYGDLLGKGGTNLVGMKKHSGMIVEGLDCKFIGCSVYSKAFGHMIAVQGGRNVYFQDCHVEAVTRTTDEMLAETSGLAYGVNFASVWPNYDGEKVITPGYTKSLSEDGYRAYGSGATGFNTAGITLVNCTAKNVRVGFALEYGGPMLIQNCEATGCEGGYNVADATIENSRGDAVNGPLLYLSGNNSDVELALMPTLPTTTLHAIATIAGNNHNVTLTKWENQTRTQDHKILLGATRPTAVNPFSPLGTGSASGVTLNNCTGMPIEVYSTVSSSVINTNGQVIANNGSNNDISQIDCSDTTTGCTNYISNVTPPSGLVSGINYSYYEGSWDLLPNFNSLTAVSSGIASSIDLSNASSVDNFGLTFDGYINVPTEGEYTFYTTSDDGSALWIDGNQVVSNDGLHGANEESGNICLEAGYHEIRVEFFEKTGGNTLSVSYAGPGISKTTSLNLYGTPVISGCSLPWSDNDFTVTDQTVNYSSGIVDISCGSNVEVSMNLEGVGSMEDADYLNAYYKVNGGSQQILSENVNAFSEKTVSVSGISGNTIEIIVNAYTSYAGEVYTISDISISEDDGTTKQDQTISFGALASKNVTDADFAPGATASSGLSVSYTSSNTSVATIVNGNIRIVSDGTTTITASQAGNTTYNPAPNVTRTLTVNEVNTSGNLALNGAATQSSTSQAHGGEASRAIDGNTNGNWSTGSVTHTESETNPWWQVDLGSNQNIGDINIFNRTDSCCMDRLTNFTVSVIDASGNITFSQSFTSYPDPSITVNADGANGSIVKIQLNGTNVLSLAEVEVYAGTPNTNTNTITIQEDAVGFCNADGSIDNNHAGHTGTGFTNTDNATANGIDWKIDGSAGSYTFTWSYASSSDRSAKLIVDGSTVVSNIAFNATGGWTSWDTESVTINLSGGAKDVRLEATNTSGLGNIDYIEVTGLNVSASDCVTDGTGDCSDFFNGITVSHVNPSCSNNDGQIIVSFANSSAHTQIQLSIDGGSSYPVTVNDNSGSYSFTGLNIAEYELAARYAENDCEYNIAHVNLVEDCGDITLNPGGVSWHDSYEANGFCWCSTNFDHNLDDKVVTINGTQFSVVDICDELEQHPLFRDRNDGDNIYNDVQ